MNDESTLTITARELNTVLAALRNWQSLPENERSDYMPDFFDGSLQDLSNEEIDAFCDRIN